MNRDDVIRLAREAGISDTAFDFQMVSPDDLERFASLVAAAEREACAKVCEESMGAHRARVLALRNNVWIP